MYEVLFQTSSHSQKAQRPDGFPGWGLKPYCSFHFEACYRDKSTQEAFENRKQSASISKQVQILGLLIVTTSHACIENSRVGLHPTASESIPHQLQPHPLFITTQLIENSDTKIPLHCFSFIILSGNHQYQHVTASPCFITTHRKAQMRHLLQPLC